jgi:hypothetical protein
MIAPLHGKTQRRVDKAFEYTRLAALNKSNTVKSPPQSAGSRFFPGLDAVSYGYFLETRGRQNKSLATSGVLASWRDKSAMRQSIINTSGTIRPTLGSYQLTYIINQNSDANIIVPMSVAVDWQIEECFFESKYFISVIDFKVLR